MKNMQLYQIEFPNGKKYIGISVDAKKRFKDHIYHAKKGVRNYPVYNAMRKYGIENISMRVLVIGEQEYIREAEKNAIVAFNTRQPNGYNLSHGGDIAPSSCPEVAEKIRQSKIRHWKDATYRKNMVIKNSGKKMTEEQNQKNREAKKKNWSDPEYRKKVTAAHVGHKASAETKAKMSAAHMGHKNYNTHVMIRGKDGRLVGKAV